MAGVEELDRELRVFIGTHDVPRLTSKRCWIGTGPIGEPGHRLRDGRTAARPPDAIVPLLAHHVHRVVKHDAAEFLVASVMKTGARGLASHENGQGTDVVLMRMRQDDRVHGVVGRACSKGAALLAVEFRVKPGIENQSLAGNLQTVRVRADLRRASKISKCDIPH